ncbi:caspase family protein [Micromonospora sp. HUAS LYJ1]|uniref:caspase family protein n=1 Tax=Micromonospora sp. HUAS LYJ1 TaxID=3061626 RepID=UPI0026731456|nr:caspase family protein [Micromonospora sp. HUAS LYJ1]WKU05932.1 caspase family protein [Micromonospora sp. HUAS LYJ1]
MTAAYQPRFDPTKSRAVLLGVSRYDHLPLTVPAARDNIEALATAFADPAVWGLPRRRIAVVPDPTADDLAGYVEDAAQLVGEDGMLVVYYAGHAVRVGRSMRLLPREATDNPGTEFPVEGFVAAAQGAGARHRLLILDCCHAGNASAALPAEQFRVDEELSGWQLLAAVRSGPALDAGPDELHTPFTRALLEVFTRGRADAPEWLSPTEVLREAGELLAGEGYPAPARSPVEFDRGWVRNPAWRPPQRRPVPFPRRPAGSPADQGERSGFESAWPARQVPFAGRVPELARGGASLRLPQGAVLPVVGPRHAGKRYFVDEVLARFAEEAGQLDEVALLRLDIPNSSAPEPVLGVLARELDVTIDDVTDYGMDYAEAVRTTLVEELQRQLHRRRLILFVEGSRLGTRPEAVRAQLERLLELSVFDRALVIIATRAEVHVSGDNRLRYLPVIQLRELSEGEATALVDQVLSDPLYGGGLTITGLAEGRLWTELDDKLVRLPGVLHNGVDELANDVLNKRIEQPGVEHLIDALLRRSAATVGAGLRDVDCFALWTGGDGERGRPGALAVLTAWAITDGLWLSTELLESMGCGLTPQATHHLVEARILTQQEHDGTLWHDLGRSTRHALSNALTATLRGSGGGNVYGRALVDGAELTPDQLDEPVAEAMFALVMAMLRQRQRHPANSDRHVLLGVDRAIGCLDEAVVAGYPRLRETLTKLAAAFSGDAAFSPVRLEATTTPSDADPVTTPGEAGPPVVDVPADRPVRATDYPVVAGAARLNQAMRATGQSQQVREAFVAAADAVAEAIGQADRDALSHRLLKSIDTALFIGGRRLRAGTSLLPARERAAPVLAGCARVAGGSRPELTTVAISWLLNTVDLQLTSGRVPAAREALGTAFELFDLMPEPVTLRDRFAFLQMRHRLLCGRARGQRTLAERVATLAEATAAVSEGLALSGSDSDRGLWSMRLCGVATLLVAEQPTFADQAATGRRVVEELTAAWGSPARWPGDTRMYVWRLLHAVHRGDPDVVSQLDAARRTMALVLTDGEFPLFPGIEAEVHLFVAHCLRRNNQFAEATTEAEVALECAKRAHEDRPGAQSLLRELRIQRELGGWRAEVDAPPRSGDAPRSRPRDQKLLRRIREVQNWLAEQEHTTWHHAVLDLWCHRARWSSEGNLLAASTPEGRESSSVPPPERLVNIRRLYRVRRDKLDGHLRRFSHSIELLQLEVGLERQYRRWLGVLETYRDEQGVNRRNDVDNSTVWELIRAAEQRWPDHPGVLEVRAEFHRYIWEYRQAIETYRRLIGTASDGRGRLRHGLAMVEAVVGYAQFAWPRNDPDPRPLLLEAGELLAAEEREGPLLEQSVILRTRVDLELNREIAWSDVEKVATEIMSDGGYTEGVAAMLNRRWSGDSVVTSLADPGVWRITADSAFADQLNRLFGSSPRVRPPADREVTDESHSTIADFLRENFTEVQLLRGLGAVYLRMAELRRDPAQAVRAFHFFDGCRVFQQVHLGGRVTPITNFLMARAILLAAELTFSADPITEPCPWEGRSWLEYAERLLQSSKDESVGEFGKQCSHFRKETSNLLRAVRVRQGMEKMRNLRRPR